MKMNRILALLLCGSMAASVMAGCSSGSPSGSSGGSSSGSSSAGSSSGSSSSSEASSFDASKEIAVISRESGSGTRGAFIELFGVEVKDDAGNKSDMTTSSAVEVNQTEAVISQVVGNPYAIGYISMGSLSDSVKALEIDGAAATVENIESGTYKVSRPFNIIPSNNENPVKEDFIAFIMSQEGQAIVANDYIPVDAQAAAFSGSQPSGTLVVGGSSSVAPLMEKLIEAYNAVNPNAEIELQTSDSGTGIKNAVAGTYDIGMASRALTDEESAQLPGTVIATDGIAVIVNPENPVAGLSTEQVHAIYVGDTTTWSELA